MYKSIYHTLSKRGYFTLLALLISIATFAQNVTVKGVVYDETNLPLIGATVQVKGGQAGAATNLDGNFTVMAAKNATLVVSYIGYQPQEIKLQGKTQLTIKLMPDNQTLDEVVVVGYGTMRKSDLTGSVASLSSKNVEGFKTSSVMESLGGQIAGVQITQSDGTPGSGFSINIRGVGTMTGDASPLFIVDGFEVPNIDHLANSDIESIEILKDASASAIYGARAANGVVLVTTKSGKVGKPVIVYNGSASYRQLSKSVDMLTPYEFVQLQVELKPEYATTYYREGSKDGIPYRHQSIDDYIGEKGIDWQSETFNPTWSQDHNVTISGGTEDTKYSASFAHYNENGIFKNSGFKKTTGKFRINQKLTKAISLDATFNYSDMLREGVGTTADNGRFNMLAMVLRARPTGGNGLTDEELLASAIDPLELSSSESISQVNPIKQAESVTNKRNAETWGTNLALTVNLAKNLTFKTAATYNTTNTRADLFYGQESREAYRNGSSPYGQTQMTKDLRWSNNNTLMYKKKINKKNTMDLMVGHEFTFRSSEYLLGQAKDFPYDQQGNDNLGLGATPSKVETYKSEKKSLSFFARGTYNYDNRYMMIATVRADGSTVFSQKNKWGYFPSFSGAWRISEEAFIKDIEWISNMKVRLGWGVVGNDRISNNLSLDLYQVSKYGVGNNLVSVLNPKQLPNKNLKWEGSSTTNLGVDLGFFNSRLNVTADFFIKNTKDLLLDQDLAYVGSGFSTQKQNIGKIQNKGIELSISSTNIQNRNFSWQTDFNISFIKNTLEALQPGTNVKYDRAGFSGDFKGYDYIATINSPLGQMYGYVFDGVYQYSDFNQVAGSDQLVLKPGVTDIKEHAGVKEVAPGMVKYKDIDGDGVITTNDRTVIGNGIPKWYGGISNTFRYKNIDFSFMLQFNYGNDIYNATRLFSTQSQDERSNQLAEVADRWTSTHASNKVPSAKGYIKNELYSRYIEDGSFLRVKNVILGYTFPSKWTRKAYISRLRAYASAQNLFCISGYSGYDPEVSTAASNPMTPGLDWGAYPKSRVITFGLEVQF